MKKFRSQRNQQEVELRICTECGQHGRISIPAKKAESPEFCTHYSGDMLIEEGKDQGLYSEAVANELKKRLHAIRLIPAEEANVDPLVLSQVKAWNGVVEAQKHRSLRVLSGAEVIHLVPEKFHEQIEIVLEIMAQR